MFGGSLRRGRCPIGIDLGAHSIKMIQLERRCGGDALPWAVHAAALRELPADLPACGLQRIDAVSEIIREMIATGGFVGRKVVSCLPATCVQYKNLRLPPMPAAELKNAVEWEAADRMYFDRTKVQLQFFDAGEVRQGEETRQEIILMAAPIADVEEHVAALTRCRLEPLAIDVIPAALARSVGMEWHSPAVMQLAQNAQSGPLATEADQVARVIIDLGRSTAKVLIVRRGRIAFFKLIEVGSRHFDEAVAARLAITPHEACRRRQDMREALLQDAHSPATSRPAAQQDLTETLAQAIGELSREIQLCLRYYSVTFRGRRPDGAVLVGGESNDPVLAQMLAEQVGIQIVPVSPFECVDVSRVPRLTAGARTGLGQWAVAVGLSMRGSAHSAPGAGHSEAAA